MSIRIIFRKNIKKNILKKNQKLFIFHKFEEPENNNKIIYNKNNLDNYLLCSNKNI